MCQGLSPMYTFYVSPIFLSCDLLTTIRAENKSDFETDKLCYIVSLYSHCHGLTLKVFEITVLSLSSVSSIIYCQHCITYNSLFFFSYLTFYLESTAFHLVLCFTPGCGSLPNQNVVVCYTQFAFTGPNSLMV